MQQHEQIKGERQILIIQQHAQINCKRQIHVVEQHAQINGERQNKVIKQIISQGNLQMNVEQQMHIPIVMDVHRQTNMQHPSHIKNGEHTNITMQVQHKNGKAMHIAGIIKQDE